ncbi:MAG: LptA/OstA family protein [Rhodospirillales bacterium]
MKHVPPKGCAFPVNVLSVIFLALPIAMAVAPWGGELAAQSLNFAGGSSDEPIEIFADDGIEWQQDNLILLARGNARAVRGSVKVHADELRAYYRELQEGGTDIWRLDAKGNVRITSPGETVYGDFGIYDIDNAILVVKGKKVRFATDNDQITADEQLEYWERKKMAVARGNASAVRGDKRLRADVLVAYFRRGRDGKTAVYKVEAFGNVRIVTKMDDVRSNKGIYNVESGIATLTGSVTMLRGSSRLTGCSAEVNLNTGISKLFSCGPSDSGGKRVQGVIKSRNLNKK